MEREEFVADALCACGHGTREHQHVGSSTGSAAKCSECDCGKFIDSALFKDDKPAKWEWDAKAFGSSYDVSRFLGTLPRDKAVAAKVFFADISFQDPFRVIYPR